MFLQTIIKSNGTFLTQNLQIGTVWC